jgi:hypothetical protein
MDVYAGIKYALTADEFAGGRQWALWHEIFLQQRPSGLLPPAARAWLVAIAGRCSQHRLASPLCLNDA